ncbi:MAG: hypothetical protein ACR2IE_06390 [Candidatus Sumerlaeaceae bacterium]
MSTSLPPPLPPNYVDTYLKSQPVPGSPVTPPRSIAGVVLSLLLALSLVYPIVQLMPISQLISNRAALAARHGFFQMDNEEGALLYQSLELNRGHSIYKPLTSYPYVVGTYPPLYMFVTSWTLDRDTPSFSQGRLLCWISCLGIAVIIALLIAIRTLHVTAGITAALLYLSTLEVFQWVAYYRVDFPAIYFSLIGLAFVALAPRYAPARVLSIVCFTLALYTKQTVIAAPLACVIALCVRDWRMGLRYTVMLALAIAVPFAILTAATRGQYAIHTVLYNMNVYHPHELKHWFKHVWFMHQWLLMAATLSMFCAAVLAALRGGRPRSEPTVEQSAGPGFWRDFAADPIYLYALLACLSFFAIAKSGTAENYLIEPIIGVVLMTGYSLGRLSDAISFRTRGFTIALLGAIATVLILFAHVSTVVTPEARQIRFNQSKNPTRVDFAAADKVARVVREEQKPTFTELAMFNLRAKRDPVLQPFILSELARQGRWNQQPFLDDLRDQKFGLIVTQYDVESAEPTDVFTKEIIQAMSKYYEEEKMIRGLVWPRYHLLRPRKEPRDASFDKYLTMAVHEM